MDERLSRVRCFLLDMDGTFYLGDSLVDGALKFIDYLQDQEMDFIFLTNNSSKHRGDYAKKISGFGLDIPETKIFTSGEATALHLLKLYSPSTKLYVVGTPSLEEEFRQKGFALVMDEPEAVVLGFDTTMTYEKMWRLCDYVRAGVPYIATHPDFNCPTEDGFMPDIGAMIAFVRASTEREPDLIIGKPNRHIIDTLSEKMELPISRLVMIGDRLYTDIALGDTCGITTVLVLSGETKSEDLEASPYQPDFVFSDIGEFADSLIEDME